MSRVSDPACASCANDRSWNQLQTEKQQAFAASSWSLSQGIEQLERSSPLAVQAHALGHARPFLLLCSMRPALRAQVGSCLGVPLLATPAFGDPHREAWALLSSPGTGLAARASGGPSPQGLLGPAGPAAWYHVVRRVLDRSFGGPPRVVLPTGVIPRAGRDPSDSALPALEHEALARVARFCLETGRIRAVDFAREDKEGLHLVLGHYLGAESGGEDDRAVLNYALRVMAASRGVKDHEEDPAGTSREQAAADKARKPFPVPPDLAPLFNAVIIILNQRIILAGEGISPERFYHDTQDAQGASTVTEAS